jgi:hypothetical protein
MNSDYLSRLPSLQVSSQNDTIAAFDPFQPNLKDLQNQDSDLLDIFTFLNTNNWPSHLT